MGQPPPLADGQAAGHFHQALDEAELLLLRVADSQVSTVHVDLPRHLLWTTYFYLVMEEYHIGNNGYTSSQWEESESKVNFLVASLQSNKQKLSYK